MPDPKNPIRTEIDELRKTLFDPTQRKEYKKAPAKSRAMIYALFGYDEQGERWGWQGSKEIDALKEEAARFSRDEMERFLRQMTPRHADAILAIGDRCESQPYDISRWGSSPFRLGKKGGAILTEKEQRELRNQPMLDVFKKVGPLDAYDLEWIAERLSYLDDFMYSYGAGYWTVLAAKLSDGSEEAGRLLEILEASVMGTHEIGRPSSGAYLALMSCDRPEAWDIMEKLLLSAQRDEGLRQSILEMAIFGHIGCFKKLLSVIVENDLVRFSSVARTIDVWLALGWDSASQKVLQRAASDLCRFLHDDDARDAALTGGTAIEADVALFAAGYADVGVAIEHAERLLQHDDPEHRFAAVRLLKRTRLLAGNRCLMTAVDDPDLRIAWIAARSINASALNRELALKLREQIDRWPKRQETKAILYPWCTDVIEQNSIASLLVTADEPDAVDALPYMKLMEAHRRGYQIRQWSERESPPARLREAVFELSGEGVESVISEVFKFLRAQKTTPSDAERRILESRLTSAAKNRRKYTLDYLESLGDAAALDSAQKLAESTNKNQRSAGLELARRLAESDRARKGSLALAKAFRESNSSPTDEEEKSLAAIEAQPSGGIIAQIGAVAKSGDAGATDSALLCFGLVDPKRLTSGEQPKLEPFEFATGACAAMLKALDDLVHKHREETFKDWSGDDVSLGTAYGYHFPSFGYMDDDEEEEGRQGRREFPLGRVWEDWYANRPAKQRDADGLEMTRLHALHGMLWREEENESGWSAKAKLYKEIMGPLAGIKLRYTTQVREIMHWLALRHQSEDDWRFRIEAQLQAIARISPKLIKEMEAASEKEKKREKRSANSAVLSYLQKISNLREMFTGESFGVLPGSDYIGDLPDKPEMFDALDPQLLTKLRRGLVWWDHTPAKSHADTARARTTLTAKAWLAGDATEDELVAILLKPSDKVSRRGSWSWRSSSSSLSRLSARKLEKLFERDQATVHELIDRITDRLLDVEEQRGEKETEASSFLDGLRCVRGSERLGRIVAMLGKEKLKRGGSSYSRTLALADIVSHLVRVALPDAEDEKDPDAAAARLRKSIPKDNRLVEVAMHAPQWADYVERALGWDGLADGVWWFYAHTDDNQSNVSHEMREEWVAKIAERTPLTSSDLLDGAVDVEWFQRAYKRLGAKRWTQLDKSAKFASSHIGHARARIFADAMRGELDRDELLEKINDKRRKDNVRALGLLPLATKVKEREADVLLRYEALQKFLYESRKFGAQRKQSEGRAVEIALDNLARTAGFADPSRLRWAMEIRSLADLAKGSKSITRGETTVTLSIDELGDTELQIEKKGKPLKNIPAALKKDEEIIALRTRRNELKKQVSRLRRSLEESMVRGDTFLVRELKELRAHPLLAPMLTSLVFVDGKGKLGWLGHDSASLRHLDGSSRKLPARACLRLAHPCDLLESGEWTGWQRDCFVREIIQPFKQVFRELYVPTDREKEDDRDGTTRYAGHQLQPRQAFGVLGSRGWVVAPEEGVRRTFFAENLSAMITFEEHFYTAAEVEGLTLSNVRFTRRGEWKLLPLAEIPPRIFSEVMRDVDLVVSVAHRTGVDPETSESSIEVRAALARETAALLKLTNVVHNERSLAIRGKLAEYSLHLGSAEARVIPGGHLPLVAVHAGHRGRLFLPFVDDDPKSAELISKMIMLARDEQIKDPTLRERIDLLSR